MSNQKFTKEELESILKEVNEQEESGKVVEMDQKSPETNEIVGKFIEQIAAKKATEEEHITTIADLKSYSAGNVIRLPGFGPGQNFVARVKRPSLMFLAKIGKIPNQLLSAASTLFNTGSLATEKSLSDDKKLETMYDICKIMAEAALVEPTFKDIKDAGLELTDEQLLSIFTYTQQGPDMLRSFRSE